MEEARSRQPWPSHNFLAFNLYTRDAGVSSAGWWK